MKLTSWNRSSNLFNYGLLVGISILLSIVLFNFLQDPIQLDKIPLAGGITTVQNRSSQAFTFPSPGLNQLELEKHTLGDIAFDAIFVTRPAAINPGLGPLFNNSSCSGCHINNGRGMPELGQALVRVSLPAASSSAAIDPQEGVIPVPQIGTQIRDRSIQGVLPDAIVKLNWSEETGQYPDGQTYHLRQPQLTIEPIDLQKPIPSEIDSSFRIPPPVFGTGLLEAVSDQTLLDLADPDDRNGDGISGRVNEVWNLIAGKKTIGRFGLKANSPNLLLQTASAYVNDMGVTNPIFPGKDVPTDIDQKTLEASTFYVQSLGVPARTQLEDKTVRKGERLFAQTHCISCHLPTLKTGDYSIQALAHQTIHPYTDLLLHDLGTGLADHRPDFAATGQEWRTTPLWGLGLTQTALPYSGYLHDGRARTLEEAILWHGGEAESSKLAFMNLPQADRQALLKFLNSL